MTFCRCNVLLAAIILAFVRLNATAATDPEIDRLLKKLPPPEKLVKADERFIRINDPALRDPLLKQIEAASNAKQSKRALGLSRQLAARYPSSATANFYAGYFAAEQKRYAEASNSFRRALEIQPQFVVVHYYLGWVEWEQRHYKNAMQHLRQVTKLDPRASAGWAVRSLCAEMLGARQESVMAARRLVELEPGTSAAWMRLAMAEKNAGNYNAATRALNRAIAVERARKGSGQQKVSSPKKKAKRQ